MKLCRAVALAFLAASINFTVFAQENVASQGGSSSSPSTGSPAGGSLAASAMAGRVAVINTGAFSADDGIVQLVGQLKRVNDSFKDRNAEIEAIKQKMEALQAELEKQGPNLTPKARADKQEMLDDLKADGQTKQQKFERDYTKAVRDATDPVVERVNAFLDNYCKQRGIVLVLEAAVLYQARGLAYVDASLDITRDFIETYNKSVSSATPQPSAPSGDSSTTNNPAAQKPAASPGTSNVRPPAPKKP